MKYATQKRRRRTNVAAGKILKGGAERYLVDPQGKRVAVVLDIEKYKSLVASKTRIDTVRISEAARAKLVKLARQAKGSWKKSEGTGTAVEIVRRLRDEWK